MSNAALTVQTPGGLLHLLHWLSVDQREYPADRQGSPPPAPCRAAAVETLVTCIITGVRGRLLPGPLGITLLCHLSEAFLPFPLLTPLHKLEQEKSEKSGRVQTTSE